MTKSITTSTVFVATEIATAVRGIYDLGLEGNIIAPKIPFMLGVDAVQDYRAIVSFVYSLRIDIISLMYVSDKPLQDRPTEGSLEDNDTGRADENELERLELLEEACRVHAAFSRHAQSLSEKARTETEEAGKRTADGGRFRLGRKNRGFNAYLNSFEDWLVDQKANATKDSIWLQKLELAEEEVGFPIISETDAQIIVDDYFADETAEKISHKAWAKLVGNMLTYGENLDAHNKKIEAFNASDRSEAKTAQFAQDCKEFRAIRKSALWWNERHISPWALLCATGTPAYLTNSSEWRTQAALKRAAEAKCKAQEAQAAATEAMATSTEIEANMALFAARNALAIVQAKVAKQLADFEAMTSPKKPKDAPLPKKAPKGAERKAKDRKDVSNLPKFPANPGRDPRLNTGKH